MAICRRLCTQRSLRDTIMMKSAHRSSNIMKSSCRSVGGIRRISLPKKCMTSMTRGDRHITLRPEGTAPVVRSYVKINSLRLQVQNQVVLLHRPNVPLTNVTQKAGRLRQFHQIGVECFGSEQSCNGCRNHCHGSAIPERTRDWQCDLALEHLGKPCWSSGLSKPWLITSCQWRIDCLRTANVA